MEKKTCEEELQNCPICDHLFPQRYLNCHAGFCANCNMLFGTWNYGTGILNKRTETPDTCCICLEDRSCFILPKCNHFLCDHCYHKLVFTPSADIPIRKDFKTEQEFYEAVRKAMVYEKNRISQRKCPLCRKSFDDEEEKK